jgi:hypothetical protein
MIATGGFVFLVFSSSWVRSLLPYHDSDLLYVGLIFLPMVVLVLVAVAVKLIEVKRDATWPQTSGQVIKFGTVARHHQFSGEATTRHHRAHGGIRIHCSGPQMARQPH